MSTETNNLHARVGPAQSWGRNGCTQLVAPGSSGRTVATMDHDDARVSAADLDTAEEIAWTMALEGRRLSASGFARLLDTVVAERHRLERAG
jgi:hypothetical protein